VASADATTAALPDDIQPESPPIDVLIVATWFPAYDDPTAGRFVADGAEALATIGAARPLVVSFDGSRLSGGATSRDGQARVVQAAAVAAVGRLDPLFVAPAAGVGSDVPVARLSIAEGTTRTAGAGHAASHRRDVLAALGERLASADPRRGVVHAHTAYPDGAAAIALADRLGWPLVITEHASFVERMLAEPALRAQYEAALARTHRLFAVSEMLAGELRAAFPDHAAKIQVVPNAVPVEAFRAAPLGDRITDELLFVGYLKDTKGIDTLLRAVAAARAERPTVTLRLVGGSPTEALAERWRSLVEELELGDAVTFDGPTDRAGVAAAMARASAFVHPSPRETFGVVAVEALASGTPVVATDSGGVSEILGDSPERVGAIVPVDDPAALGRAIVSVLERRSDFDPLELRSTVERRFGSAVVAERLLVAYREALALAAAPPLATAPPLAEGSPMADGSQPLAVGSTRPTGEPPPTMVVALDRERAARRLAPLPGALRGRLRLVTAREPAAVALPEGLDVVEIDVVLEAPARHGLAARRGWAGRIGRFASDPVGTVRRRLGRDPGSAGSLAAVTSAIREIVRRDGRVVGLEILPLDGHDHVAVAPLFADGTVILAAGGVRRLADLDLAARGGGPPI
jgi:glycogen(starch) synthase